jgi:hypothetical protein
MSRAVEPIHRSADQRADRRPGLDEARDLPHLSSVRRYRVHRVGLRRCPAGAWDATRPRRDARPSTPERQSAASYWYDYAERTDPDDLHAKVSALAEAEHISVNSALVQAAELWVAQRAQQALFTANMDEVFGRRAALFERLKDA